ncbi:hypothetical protein [Actinacidiphila acididurans]|uniref:hypothetical protein n=1 Tax=Actinacidiphila acididurans TaxID=2784346 RepID=UPI001F453D4F|nr:hypothetical protein [Actinacidiphila acididurans]
MPAPNRIVLEVVGAADVDDEELQELTLSLRRHLLDLDVDDVRPAAGGQAPQGAKPAGTVAVGALVLTAAPVLLRAVLRCVEEWLRNRPVRTVRLELSGRTIELGAASAQDQRRLIEEFVRAGETAAADPAGSEGAGATDRTDGTDGTDAAAEPGAGGPRG